jgi:hypothetical protein
VAHDERVVVTAGVVVLYDEAVHAIDIDVVGDDMGEGCGTIEIQCEELDPPDDADSDELVLEEVEGAF